MFSECRNLIKLFLIFHNLSNAFSLAQKAGELLHQSPIHTGTYISAPCTTHIIHRNLEFENHQLNKIFNPFLISSLSRFNSTTKLGYVNQIMEWNKKEVHSNNSNTPHHRRFCMFLIFYSNPTFDNLSIGILLRLHVLQYFHTGAKSYNFNRDVQLCSQFYALLITYWDLRIVATTVIYQFDFIISSPQFISAVCSIVPNFAVLYVDKHTESNRLCIHTPRMTFPFYKRLVCTDKFIHVFPVYAKIQGAKNVEFDLLNTSPSIWRSYSLRTKTYQVTSADFFVAKTILMDTLNLTVRNAVDCSNTDIYTCSDYTTISPMQSTYYINTKIFATSFVTTMENNAHFMTCSSNEVHKFAAYIDPFDLSSWVGIVLGIVIVSILLAVGRAWSNNTIHRDSTFGLITEINTGIVGMIWLGISLLGVIESGFEKANSLGSVGKPLVCLWVTMGVVLCSGY